jgi:hypothetical protein
MVRRDEIIEKLGKFNSTDVINEQVEDLEKYIDTELQKEENIKKLINSSSIGAASTSGLERVTQTNITNSVHRDITTVGDDKVIIGTGVNAVSYVEWNENTENDITKAGGGSASTEPWNDRTIAENQFDGTITIECPVGTNKNTAFALAEKYMKIGDFDSDGNPTVGFWSNAVRPNDKDNNVTTGTPLTDAVIVIYDKDEDKVYMKFKIF